jgi:hypothetical protein
VGRSSSIRLGPMSGVGLFCTLMGIFSGLGLCLIRVVVF